MSAPNATVTWTIHDSAGDNSCEVELDVYFIPSLPANLNGHPDTWTPAEGGECEVLGWSLADSEPLNDWIAERMADEEFRRELEAQVCAALEKVSRS